MPPCRRFLLVDVTVKKCDRKEIDRPARIVYHF